MNFNFTVLHTHLVGWAPGKPIAGWGDMSEDAIARAKEHGGKPKTMTATYVFGNTEVNERFPNIYKAFPPPEPQSLSPEREAELNAQYDAAQQVSADADTSLQDREEAAYNRSADRLRLEQDNAARLLEIQHGGRPASSVATLPEDGRGILDVDLSDITGKSSWQTP